MVRLQSVLDTWKAMRADTIQAVTEFPEEAFDERPIEDVMSFRETARHILDSTHALTGALLSGVENWATPEFRPSLKNYVLPLPADAGQSALAAALQSSLESRSTELAAKSPEFYAHEITRFDGQRLTRLEALLFIKEHELTHRSQLFTLLRLKGIVPNTTRRRRAMQQKA